MAYVTIDMPSSQQQHSSDSMQNNNGDNRSLVSTVVGAQEKSVPITALLEMGSSRLGVLVCGWVVLMLVQGGIVVTVETKDRVSVTVLFFLVCFRCWRYFYPQDTGSLTEATQSLSADNIQQLAIPIGFISRLFYWWNLISVMTCVVLSMMRLASQDFGQIEVANKVARDFALNVFYGLAFAEALVLLFALTFVTIMAVQRKVTEALIEWVKPSQLAQAPPTHQNTTLFERAKCQVHPNSVGYSHLPASEPHDSVKPSQLAQAPPTHQNTTLLERAECQVHPNSVGYSHLPASKPLWISSSHDWSYLNLKPLNWLPMNLFPRINFSNLIYLHIEVHGLFPVLDDILHKFKLSNMKGMRISVVRSLRRRVSSPAIVRLKGDYSPVVRISPQRMLRPSLVWMDGDYSYKGRLLRLKIEMEHPHLKAD